MDAGSDVRRRVTRFKLQLTDAAESATVLRILQKLKDLDITLDILAETGIGKIVNSFRRHEEAGEFAKSLVRGWKKLIPKSSTSNTDDGSVPDFTPVKDKSDEQIIPDKGGLTTADLNNNCSTSHHSKSQKNSDEQFFAKADAEKQGEGQKIKKNQNGKSKLHSKNGVENDIWGTKVTIQEEGVEVAIVSKEKKIDHCNSKSGDLDHLLGNSEEIHGKSRLGSKEKLNSSNCTAFGSDSEPDRKSKPSKQSTKYSKESFSSEPSDRSSKKALNLDGIEDVNFSDLSRSSEAPNRKRKKRDKEKHVSLKQKELSKSHKKKAKMERKNEKSDTEGPCMSFESYLNYDENVFNARERSKLKKLPKKPKTKTIPTRQRTKDPATKAEVESPGMSLDALLPQKLQVFVLDHADIQFPAALLENEKALGECARRKDESDSCDVSEEFAVFTGQRLNKKMQVYSGAKTICLPAMMSLHQQCIRTLQNNINLIYETGGVPFEILQPVLERCTPEQLLRIEEFNPIYIGVTDHLWGKHCQRDFKDRKLLEYESWKEMYIRLSEEREKKFQRLTKTISSAHSKKPKGRQVKMAFIHTVAKPPRDVRIQQEIHGTAVQQPHQLRCSVKVQDNRTRTNTETTRSNRPSTETTRSNCTSSGTSSTQDPRKKTRVAPMMAKSLKAFKKQLGRR